MLSQECRLNPDADARFDKCRLGGETRSGRVRVELFNGWDRSGGCAAELRDAAIDLAGERDGRCTQRNDGAGAGNRLSEAECRLCRGQGVGTKAIEVEQI